ncbi:Protein kinase superfamily protein with octicosapeptide/Phox/Bem1p domain [Prunus dulcis]|uniref:Protein kinase superfamily protein with octicosapeptide/Phox/Bem1p domain n=1 Tax=Prunus dulcis TaxID=3755 RepID=A0A4Y1QN97_PRUDU|nr:Protein kinase superfamily protein with octicosapeptide/Phox/Bem1p domain [Prunus dulcis]
MSQVDYGPLNPTSLRLGLTLCSPRPARGIDGYQELTELKGYTYVAVDVHRNPPPGHLLASAPLRNDLSLKREIGKGLEHIGIYYGSWRTFHC